MRLAAVVFADFVETFLGGPSQLATRIGSRTILHHTLARLLRIDGVDERCLLVRPRDEALAAAALAEYGFSERVRLAALDDGARPRRSLIRSARKWSLSAWRGGLLGTTWFDEFIEPLAVARAFDHLGCDALLCLDGHQPALDPDIASDMLSYARERAGQAHMVFTQAPPGIAGMIVTREFARQSLVNDRPVGLTLSYRPETPTIDPITRPPCFRIASEIAQTTARFTGDTSRSRALLCEAFATLGEDCSAAKLCEWRRSRPRALAGRLPLEVELELTTDTPLPASRLRPRPANPRRLDNLDAVERLAAELAQEDDRLLMLAGHGDPLRFPELVSLCRRIRAAGVCGLGIETPLVDLSDEQIEGLLAAQVDVIEVRLDADTRETYHAVHQLDAYERVLANIERLSAARRNASSPQPLIVPAITRCAATRADIDAFYDRWIRTTGAAVIDGYNEYGGVLPPDTLLGAQPASRSACRRLNGRMMLLADGRATLCHQDIDGVAKIGDWFTTPMSELFVCDPLESARRRHAAGEWLSLPLCRTCGEWNRP